MNFAVKRTNRALLGGWALITVVLFLMYLMEVYRGDRTFQYLGVFSLITILPLVFVSLNYFRKPESEFLQYDIVIGYMLMYVFVLFTGHTVLVFTYILPMLSLLVLYHNPKLIFVSSVLTAVFNIGQIVFRYATGDIDDLLDRDIRIQVALLILCFLALFFATRIYDGIYTNNLAYSAEVNRQKEEILLQAEEMETMNQELTASNDQLQEMTMQTIMTIANTIDAKDEYTTGHSRRVAEYSVAIAQEMGYEGEDLRRIRYIGLLHDIGKIGVPDNVLNKPGKLTKEEYQLMKDHTVMGGEILKDITIICDLDVGAKYHHERYDGTGYPEGLKGEEIPQIARIIGVADSYDAMTSNRIYRRHLNQERVVNELKKGNGSQFDPKACEALLRLLEEDRLPKLNMEESLAMRQTTQILSRVIDKAEEKAMEDIFTDELTKTLRRESGLRLIQNEISRYGRGALFIIDLDNFRRINEQEGFSVGDKYLIKAVEEIRKIDTLSLTSRMGADEFVTYLPDLDTDEEAEAVANQLIDSILHVADENKAYRMLSVCVGITHVATEKDHATVLYEYAAKALFVAKMYGTGKYFSYREDMQEDNDVAVANSADLKNLVAMLAGQVDESGADYSHIKGFDTFSGKVDELLEQGEEKIYLILFTLRWTEENTFTVEVRNDIMQILEKSIRQAARGEDVTIRYSNVQCALLTAGMEESMIRQIVNKIMASFYRANPEQGIEVYYDIADLKEAMEEVLFG